MTTKVTRPSWNLPENNVTSEAVYRERRKFIKDGAYALAAGAFLPTLASVQAWAKLNFPGTSNSKYIVDDPKRPKTREELVTSYNNFYEFSLEKDGVKPLAEKWKIPDPWKIDVGGLVEKPKTYDLDQFVALAGGQEERIYRFRCVEAWSMVVPWTGFELGKLVKKLNPSSKAKYIRFTTYNSAKDFPNLGKVNHYDWPYREGLRMDEAMHPLALLVTGVYGKPLPGQNGAPLRLIVPWKYGFKSIKSINKIEFIEEQPKTLWNTAAPNEYGFYANVNPEVSHPRWSQATERILDGKLFPTRIPTLKFNGYESEVAGLYAGMDLKKNY